MRESDLILSGIPASLRGPMRAAAHKAQAPADEVAAVVEAMLAEAIAERFGAEPAETIALAVLERRQRRDAAAKAEIERAGRPKLRKAV